MDWPRARGILLIAFLLVNLILAYSVWGPTALFPDVIGSQTRQQAIQVRTRLSERGFDLAVGIPPTPGPMRFLRVEYRPTLEFPNTGIEPSLRPQSSIETPMPLAFDGALGHPVPSIEKGTQALIYRPNATGTAELDVRLDHHNELEQDVRRYLRAEQILPAGAQFSGVFPKPTGGVVVEYNPVFDSYPVFSGFVRTDVSTRGIETITKLWVQPKQYKDAPSKAVRPAAEAVLRLAGHLERSTNSRRTITDIRLGYYAGRALTALQADVINGWDTVPVWRISLDTGEVYFINAFNGELES